MKKSFFHLGVILLLTAVCFTHNFAENSSGMPNSEVSVQLDRINAAWVNDFNSSAAQLEKYYFARACFFPAAGDYIGSSGRIAKYWLDKAGDISKITSIHSIARYAVNSSVLFEIGYFLTGKQGKYHFIIVWRRLPGDKGWVRQIEAAAENTVSSTDFSAINKARDKWVQTAAKYGAKELVSRMYTEKSVYYMGGSIFQGSGIAASPGYAGFYPGCEVSLQPRTTIGVQPDLVYEIGEYKINSATGYYILIWSKGADGQWRIRLDSNF